MSSSSSSSPPSPSPCCNACAGSWSDSSSRSSSHPSSPSPSTSQSNSIATCANVAATHQNKHTANSQEFQVCHENRTRWRRRPPSPSRRTFPRKGLKKKILLIPSQAESVGVCPSRRLEIRTTLIILTVTSEGSKLLPKFYVQVQVQGSKPNPNPNPKVGSTT